MPTEAPPIVHSDVPGNAVGAVGAAALPPPRPAADGNADAVGWNFRYRWIILVGLITTVILQVLDTTIVNVALPQMAGNLGATTDEIGWVSTGYILSSVVVLPMTAWLALRFGRKRYLIASVLIFIVASFFCGISRSLTEIVSWRILQGVGGAALLSTSQATLLQVFPKSQQALVLSIFGLGVIVAPTVAPALGGWLTDNYSWQWVFFVNIPIGLIAVTLVGLFLRDTAAPVPGGRVDWAGIGLLATGLGALQYVLEEGERYGWLDDANITRLIVLAVVACAGFVAWELWPGNPAPVVNLRVLKDRNLAVGATLSLAQGFGLLGGVFIFPLFVQGILHFTPTESGLALVPGGLATACAVLLCGRLLSGDRQTVDPRILIMAGILLMVGGNWGLGHLTPQSGQDDTQMSLVIRGLGLGCLIIPITTLAFSTLKAAQVAQGTAMNSLAQQLGGSFGIALLNTYVTNMTVYHRYDLASALYSGNPSFAQRQIDLAGSLAAHGFSPPEAQAGALGLINQTLQSQAQTMAYNNAFLLIAVLFALVLPLVLLFRRVRSLAPAAA